MKEGASGKKGFFSFADKAAFWAATLATFAVYFYTLGPSVGMEDSGELATAAAHLGVPHPPGYPFWTFCSWIFCKAFSFVTYMGHPTPAWAVSLASAVFGSLAAGCTAMLISRSAGDMLASRAARDGDRAVPWACFGGGTGGALAFSFSPVEWSQSTIVEIYSLNALFLVLVFLLTYRWMRRPGDRTLFLAALVFGLGLTNYQVLLFAAVPIAITICLRNFRLFRDFALYLFPVALSWQVLKTGELPRAAAGMTGDVINKHLASVTTVKGVPSGTLVAAGVALAVLSIAAAAFLNSRARRRAAFRAAAFGGGAGVAMLALAAIGLFSSDVSWVEYVRGPAGAEEAVAAATAPLANPSIYVWVAALSALAAVFAALAVARDSEGTGEGKSAYFVFLVLSGVASVAAFAVAESVPEAGPAGFTGAGHDWAASEFAFGAMFVSFIALSLFARRGIAFAIPVAGFHAAVFTLLRHGAMNGLVHPASWWFWWPVAWNAAVLALAWLALPNGRSVAGAALFAQIGVSFYAYMPIVSELRNPPMNWAYPRTWEGFKHAITRGQYEAITVPDFSAAGGMWNFIKVQMGHYFRDVKMQFSDFLAFFALVPFAFWSARKARGGSVARFAAVSFAVAALALLLVRAILSAAGLDLGSAGRAFDRFVLASMAVASLAGVLLVFWKHVFFKAALAVRLFVRQVFARRDWLRLGAAAALVLAALFATMRMAWAGPAGTGSALPFVALLAGGGALAAVAFLAPLVVAWRVRRIRSGVVAAFGAGTVSCQWLMASGACFFMMTVPLIVLANVRGDLQDGFVQKVKFISSHAMIALWIGYGLVLATVLLADVLCRRGAAAAKKSAVAASLAVFAAVCAGVFPVVQNYTDRTLVFELGGSEQNGHTFGWQFGAFQLEGASAIADMVVEGEEPLPDPDWPPPMQRSAILFGGTDPGRFVPTYMIYSANFRPDIYIITQNALPDQTYMSVERDLYGDEIWIPSSGDIDDAFKEYTEGVAVGKIAANADVIIQNGRVQVTGARGVMEIAAILARKMFEHERNNRAFYVEESYPIQWMYEFLSPHGLVMRLEPSRPALDKRLLARDADFWDWYSKRLLDDPMFRRDFAAQKNFCKLRSAIAGLYAARGRWKQAAQAYAEAILLFPASPEAVLHDVSDCLLPAMRLDIAEELVEHSLSLDPGSKSFQTFGGMIAGMREADGAAAKFAADPSDANAAAAVAAFRATGRHHDAARIAAAFAAATEDPAMLEIACDAFLRAGWHENAEAAIIRYSRFAKPPAADIVANLPAVQAILGKNDLAHKSFDMVARAYPALACETMCACFRRLPEDRLDATLLLKVARTALSRLDRRRGGPLAEQCFILAMKVSQERVMQEMQFDKDLQSLFFRIYDKQRRN